MPSTSRQQSLVAEFEQSRAAIRDFVASRNQQERSARGTPEQWSASELLTAIGFWMEYMVERMEYFVRGEEPPREVDFGGVQHQALAAQADWTWEQRAAGFEHAMAALLNEVRRCDDTQLEARNWYAPWPEGGPLFGEVQANGFIWPLQELEKYYKRIDEPERAEAVRALLTPVVGEPERVVCELTAPEELDARADGAILVIDVRGKADFARGHLPGAVHIPLADLPRKLKRLPMDRPIVTYCNMHHPGESRGERAAALLAEHGLRASALAGGYTAWEASGRPIETGEVGKA
jgi:rhodanese-related sulfurtransferase